MKNRIMVLLLMVFLTLAGCTNISKDAQRFKEEYESLNGEVNASGVNYREITIDERNPFVYADLSEINQKMDSKETFIVYFGSNWCPWCRSILPQVIETAEKNRVSKIYYVDGKPGNDDEKEIRDVYAVDDNGRVYLKHEGTEAYHIFINRAASVLADYSRSDVETLDGTEFAGQKRIGLPNFVLVVKGEAVKMITGISLLQNDPYQQLNDDILSDVNDMFTELFEELKGAQK